MVKKKDPPVWEGLRYCGYKIGSPSLVAGHLNGEKLCIGGNHVHCGRKSNLRRFLFQIIFAETEKRR